MLTGYQMLVGAYMTHDLELLCERCFESSDQCARPMSNYELDEWQVADDWLFEDHDQDVCECVQAVTCYDCGTELREAYTGPECEEEDDG